MNAKITGIVEAVGFIVAAVLEVLHGINPGSVSQVAPLISALVGASAHGINHTTGGV